MPAFDRGLGNGKSAKKKKLADMLLRLQRSAKAWLAHKQYLRAIGASVAIQAAWAGYLAKKSLKHDKDKIAFIQAGIRAWLERAKYQRLRNTAILMQAAEKCLMCSASFDKEKLALLRAQRLAKSWLARKAYGRAAGASMALQAAGANYMPKTWLSTKQTADVTFTPAAILDSIPDVGGTKAEKPKEIDHSPAR